MDNYVYATLEKKLGVNRRAIIMAFWSKLSLEQREILLTKYKYDLTYDEVGKRLGMDGKKAGRMGREALHILKNSSIKATKGEME